MSRLGMIPFRQILRIVSTARPAKGSVRLIISDGLCQRAVGVPDTNRCNSLGNT